MTRATGIAILSAFTVVFCLGVKSAPAETDGRKADDMRSVSGTVRDAAGRPLEGVQLLICPRGSRTVLSDQEGEFEIAWRHSDWAQADYLVARHAEKNLAVALPVGEETEGLNIVLEPAALLAGMVADPNGRPIADADVRVDLIAANWGSHLEQAGIEQEP
ncbi:MAG: carboxypeptidase regulatory-like domain-containing protein [Sedimentisphaerales bacterium]|nr:carboxypeptidase regulatory-like domain-containing protein [Sedimentisphaerales bacterium]